MDELLAKPRPLPARARARRGAAARGARRLVPGAAWRNVAMRLLTLASLAAALGLALRAAGRGRAAGRSSPGMLVVDPLGAAFKLILVAAGLLTVLAFSFRNSRELHGLGQGELYALVLALVLSCLLLAAAERPRDAVPRPRDGLDHVLRDGGLPEGRPACRTRPRSSTCCSAPPRPARCSTASRCSTG